MTKKLIQARVSFRKFNQDAGTVSQDIIEAGINKNNVDFPAKVLQAAAPMFEGVRTYIDHGGMFWGRSITEMSGWLTGIEFDGENQKLTANRHFTENQAGRDMREMAMSIVDGRSPEDLYGASVSVWVNGDWSGPDDESAKSDEPSMFVVTEIIGVDSVDDVDRPAAGGGWRQMVAASEDPFTAILQHANFDEWMNARPRLYQAPQE